jgi:hypothetical protein
MKREGEEGGERKRKKEHLLSRCVMPSTMLWGSEKALTRCWCCALGLPSLQNHEPKKLLFLLNYSVQYFVIATENRLS